MPSKSPRQVVQTRFRVAKRSSPSCRSCKSPCDHPRSGTSIFSESSGCTLPPASRDRQRFFPSMNITLQHMADITRTTSKKRPKKAPAFASSPPRAANCIWDWPKAREVVLAFVRFSSGSVVEVSKTELVPTFKVTPPEPSEALELVPASAVVCTRLSVVGPETPRLVVLAVQVVVLVVLVVELVLVAVKVRVALEVLEELVVILVPVELEVVLVLLVSVAVDVTDVVKLMLELDTVVTVLVLDKVKLLVLVVLVELVAVPVEELLVVVSTQLPV
mmetsp:Transcript_92928/g.220953  ORF Transcript_92928/g.220953 Transcript_92928/m.220953 type:complete len:275 (+) Transcript_92928:361-1185(+)